MTIRGLLQSIIQEEKEAHVATGSVASLTIRIIVTCEGLDTGDDRERQARVASTPGHSWQGIEIWSR